MKKEQLANIKQTLDGYEVKDLHYKAVDNIIVGLVKDPVLGRPELHDGFICCTWTLKGVITRTFKERNGNVERTDLYLKI